MLLRPSWSILDSFSDVLGFYGITTLKVGDGERQLEDAVEGAGGEVKLFHSRL
jgi:hypothetical protein